MNLLALVFTLIADAKFQKMTRTGSNCVIDMIDVDISSVIFAGEAVRIRCSEDCANFLITPTGEILRFDQRC